MVGYQICFRLLRWLYTFLQYEIEASACLYNLLDSNLNTIFVALGNIKPFSDSRFMEVITANVAADLGKFTHANPYRWESCTLSK